MSLTQVAPGMMTSTAQYYSFKNRIINGAMVINQRASGSTVTLDTSQSYSLVDRYRFVGGFSGFTNTVQQSTNAPAGFTTSLQWSNTAATTFTSGLYNAFWQNIEGYNVADLGWGTANAQSVTLSFWVSSGVTGTYGVTFTNGTNAYVGSYTINAVNTWQYVSITVPGCTTGTWNTSNSTGLTVKWDMGVGTTYTTTAGSWQTGNIWGLTGGVKFVATNSVSYYITGIQLEVGSSATAFDYRDYGRELMLCQRYYTQLELTKTLVYATTTTYAQGNYKLPVTMRSAPTATATTNATNMNQLYVTNITGTYVPSASCDTDSVWVVATNTGGTAFTANIQYRFNTSGCYLYFSSEL